MAARFELREVRFDPWQMQAVAQRLQRRGLQIVEFPQTVSNLTQASTNLTSSSRDAIWSSYPDDDIRPAINRAIALESHAAGGSQKEKVSRQNRRCGRAPRRCSALWKGAPAVWIGTSPI
jgi:phage terminase large subunit-like protein